MTQTMNPTAAQSSTTTFTRTVPQPTVAAPSNPLEETLANVTALREAPGAKRPLGSIVTVTAIFGMRCAQVLLEPVMDSASRPHRGGWRA